MAVRTTTLDLAALDRLRDAVESAGTPVVDVHGAGSAFCGGADLDTVNAVADDHDAATTLARTGQRTIDAIETTDTIVVAGIDRAARGGGVE